MRLVSGACLWVLLQPYEGLSWLSLSLVLSDEVLAGLHSWSYQLPVNFSPPPSRPFLTAPLGWTSSHSVPHESVSSGRAQSCLLFRPVSTPVSGPRGGGSARFSQGKPLLCERGIAWGRWPLLFSACPSCVWNPCNINVQGEGGQEPTVSLCCPWARGSELWVGSPWEKRSPAL